MLEDLARLIAAIEATSRRVYSVSITHPNGKTGKPHYHLGFWPAKPHRTNAYGRRIRGTSDRIWGGNVEALLTEIAGWPAGEPERWG